MSKNNRLTNIVHKIKDEINIQTLVSSIADINSFLDSRDEDDFDTQWVKAFEKLSSIESSFSQQERLTFNKFREDIYKQILEASNSSELASYLSEDFELFVLNHYSGESLHWIDDLLQAYKNQLIYRYIKGG